MKKKTILLLLVLSLALLPAVALAQTEFSLGGFIKLDSWWGSTQAAKNLNTAIARNNDINFHHGKFNMTSQGSRFNFTIKGPKLWGATVTGFIEMDFDQTADNRTSSHSYIPRLRHAMFRLNWPETELLFGQYWSMFCEYYPESVQDGPYMFHGVPTARLAQIRVTQKFLGSWTVAGLIGVGTDTSDGDRTDALGTASLNAQSSETPQVQAKIAFEQDVWGKAPFYGKPRGFVAQIVAAWQRTNYRNNNGAAVAGMVFGQSRYFNQNIFVRDHQYLDPWMVQGTLFIPVIPTYSANLAGTASVTAQWYIGQGLAAFGETRDADNTWFHRIRGNAFEYDRTLMKAFGGYVQGQYYFNNQWYTNITWGVQRHYGIDRDPLAYATAAGATQIGSDQTKCWWELDATLWYRPITAIKFGLQYAYSRTDWLQIAGPTINAAAGARKVTDNGEDHRVQFVGLYFF